MVGGRLVSVLPRSVAAARRQGRGNDKRKRRGRTLTEVECLEEWEGCLVEWEGACLEWEAACLCLEWEEACLEWEEACLVLVVCLQEVQTCLL